MRLTTILAGAALLALGTTTALAAHGDAGITPLALNGVKNAVSPPGCTTSEFFVSVFGLPAAFLDTATYAWEFYYDAGSHGSWANTDHGNTGNITP